jgi:hypothetical protein
MIKSIKNFFSKSLPPAPKVDYANVDNQHIYRLISQIKAFVNGNGNFSNVDMTTAAGKAKALQVVTPFAAMVDRMGKLFAAGKDYVTDLDNNDKEGKEPYRAVRKLIEKPNVLQTSEMFKKQVAAYLMVYGFCPIFANRLSPKDVPASLWCIPPELFTAKMSGNFLYEIEIGNVISEAAIKLDANKKMKLDDDDYFIIFTGQPQMGSNGDLIVRTPADTCSQTVNNWLYQNVARGSIILDGGPMGMITNNDTSEFGNATMTQAENERINQAFKEKYGIVGKKFNIMVSQAALRWQPMSWNPSQLMLGEARKTAMEDLCFAFGWPYGLFDPSSQYSNNLAGEERRAYTSSIIPDSLTYAAALTKFLNQPNLKYYIDFTDVDCLQKDRAAEVATISGLASSLGNMLGNKLISPLEARTLLSEYMDINPQDYVVNSQESVDISGEATTSGGVKINV